MRSIPQSGKTVRTLDVASNAGTAFDGKHLFQIAADKINKIDPETGRVLHTIPAPGNGGDSGMAWAEGSLWVGEYRARKIRQVDPETGKVLRAIESNRFVTGVTWVDGELWHGTWENEAERAAAHRSDSRARCWRASRCRRACSCRGSSPMARIASIAVAARAARSERSGGRRRARR